MTNIVLNSAPAVLTGRIFGLDNQLLFDLLFQGIAVFILFTFVGYILINPIKKMIADRQAKIDGDVEAAKKDKQEAARLKEEYDEKLKNVDVEADQILSEARRKAQKNESAIIDEARTEAGRIVDTAKKEAELEKLKVKDEVRVEIISVASMMAGKIVEKELSEADKNKLIDDTLREMGDKTWADK